MTKLKWFILILVKVVEKERFMLKVCVNLVGSIQYLIKIKFVEKRIKT